MTIQEIKNRFGIIQLRSDHGDADDDVPEEAETIRNDSDEE